MTEKNTSSLVELEEMPLPSEEEEAQSNGSTPLAAQEAEVEYLETADETELLTAISNCSDLVEELVAIPEWVVNGKVVRILLRSLTVDERTKFITSMQKVNFDLTKLYPDLVIMHARHPVTKRLIFRNADRGMLLSKIGKSLERIAMRASEISGLDENFLNSIKKN